MTDTQRNLMRQVWMRGFGYSYVLDWAPYYGISESDLPTEEEFDAYCQVEDESMNERFRREMELSTEEIE